MKHIEQSGLDLLLCQRLVAMWCEQTRTGGKYGSLAVAFYAAPFEDKVQMVFVLTFKDVLRLHLSADAVVEVGIKLLAPAVELEVQQDGPVGRKQGDEAMIASPSVVGRCFAERYAQHALGRQSFFEQLFNVLRLRCYDDEPFARSDGFCHIYIATRYIFQNGLPICVFVRPGKLYGTLFVPFCRQYNALVSNQFLLFFCAQSYELASEKQKKR